MAVADRNVDELRCEVEVALAVVIPEVAALGTRYGNGVDRVLYRPGIEDVTLCVLDDLAARLKVMEAEVEDLRARASIFRREAPSPAIVRQSFAQRWRTFRARASASEPTEREARLIGASAAYRQALEHGASALGAETHQMSLEGLTWWVPVQDSVLGSGDEWLEKQRFPYHGILQTRELAVGGIMLDLGANIGRMAIPRVILGDVSAVYCAEPDPVSFRCLASNVIDNGLRGFAMPDQTAIGDTNGTVVLRRAGASGAPRASDAMHVDLGRRGHVVVHDV